MVCTVVVSLVRGKPDFIMSDKVFMTKEGLEKLQVELKELVDIKRPEIAKKIQEAREMGDISENALYDSARQEQAFIEGRISELEEIIKNAQISTAESKDSIVVGCKVTVHIDGDQEIFHIVGAPEANPLEKKISHESPLGASLMGKRVGDKVEVAAPIGKLVYKILKIE
jgi:transcription elongation factor GreA